ncbi:DUF412 domain-containing protein [Tatumella sp. TA1]|nr:DUF412 domain-containing protein [Tatumella sp. TA1]
MDDTHRPGMFTTLRLGKKYMKSWPLEKSLSAIFPENRVCRATQFGIRFMPPIAVFILCWQITFHAQIGPAIATAVFACSLPLQGLWWLGRRAVKPLPSVTLEWFHTIREKLHTSGHIVTPPQGEVTYQHLAELLMRAFKQLDKAFFDEL